MDTLRIRRALRGDVALNDLTVAERLAFAHEVVRVRIHRPVALSATPARYILPEHIERLYRGRSS